MVKMAEMATIVTTWLKGSVHKLLNRGNDCLLSFWPSQNYKLPFWEARYWQVFYYILQAPLLAIYPWALISFALVLSLLLWSLGSVNPAQREDGKSSNLCWLVYTSVIISPSDKTNFPPPHPSLNLSLHSNLKPPWQLIMRVKRGIANMNYEMWITLKQKDWTSFVKVEHRAGFFNSWEGVFWKFDLEHETDHFAKYSTLKLSQGPHIHE